MPKSKTPNILFLVLDTHRADRLGCYGYDRGTSPNLDAFAAQATVFENAVSPGQWTIPAHASMFSGEFPTTHGTVQSSDALDARFRTLAERLQTLGYQTVGFCNNPLVGVLNNNLKRGFELFYNYGGAIPTVPEKKKKGVAKFFYHLWSRYTQLLRKISYPVQNLIAQNDRVFNFILNPLLVPLWAKHAHFKGDAPTSIRDLVEYLQQRTEDQPLFLFLNVMETHLPYYPPEKFVTKFAPIVKQNPQARAFINRYNTQALHWLLPMKQPFAPLEFETLSSMYDAEVAYQDEALGQLLTLLDTPYHRENTLVIIVGDHGEMLGEHQIMGHGLGVYQELIHVPLLIRAPGQTHAGRVTQPVSTTHLFHTVLDAVHVETLETSYAPEVDVRSCSLLPLTKGNANAPANVVSEAFPPEHVINIMQKRTPDLLEEFPSDANHWAVYRQGYKLIEIENHPGELYDLTTDPREESPLDDPVRAGELRHELGSFLEYAAARRPDHLGGSVNLDDEQLRQRLRGLGYLE
ncbi:MAG TPA: sulfatase [Anaerolineales bacterium]|nr:sulfatase [Anaerolineales bacterium]